MLRAGARVPRQDGAGLVERAGNFGCQRSAGAGGCLGSRDTSVRVQREPGRASGRTEPWGRREGRGFGRGRTRGGSPGVPALLAQPAEGDVGVVPCWFLRARLSGHLIERSEMTAKPKGPRGLSLVDGAWRFPQTASSEAASRTSGVSGTRAQQYAWPLYQTEAPPGGSGDGEEPRGQEP